METKFTAPDIECDGCAASIKRSLGKEEGVLTVAVDVSAKTVSITYDSAKTSSITLAETLAEIGFPVDGH